MDPKTRQIFLPIITFLIPVLILVPGNLSAQKKNAKLQADSAKLQASLDTVEERYKGILDGYEKDKKNLKDSLETIRRENESIQFALKKAQTQMESALDEKTYLEEMLIHKTKEIESIRTGGGAASSAPGEAAKISGQIREKDDEIRRLTEENKTLSGKLDSLYQTTNQKIAEINVAKIALEDTVSSAREKIDDQYSSVNLGTIQVDKGKTAAKPADAKKKNGGGFFSSKKPAAKNPAPAVKTSSPKATVQNSTGKKQAHVLAINEDHGFVVVDVGRADDIGPSTKLEVKKEGQTIAVLSVLEVRDVMTACNIRDLQEGQKIQVNDPVSILR